MTGTGSGALDRLPPHADERVRAFHDYWRRIAPGPGLLPGRRHFDPTAIPELLPNVWLVDVVGRPPRFRYRLIGTALDTGVLAGATGRFMDEVSPDFLGNPSQPDYLAVAQGAISWRRGAPAFHFTDMWRVIERVMLPLAEDGRHPDMMLNLTLVLERAPRQLAF
jgi:hypothetical protein